MNNKGRQKSDLIKVLKKERPIKIEHKNFLRDENNLFFFDFRRKTIEKLLCGKKWTISSPPDGFAVTQS